MTDLQGAVGIVQIKKLQKFIDYRQKWADYYTSGFESIDWLQTPQIPEGSKHGWQSYVLMIDETKTELSRNKIMEVLQDEGISTRPGTHAVHMLNYYADKFGIQPDDYPGAKQANDHSMSIPLHNRMDDDDFEYVVNAIKSLL